MAAPHGWLGPTRWEWYAAGDRHTESRITRSPPDTNSAERVLLEIALFLLVPLALAALSEIIFGG